MNKHHPHDLKQMQSLPLEAKIIMTRQRIRQWYDHWDGEVYIAFSGGKDSTVLKHIVDNTPGVWNVPPEMLCSRSPFRYTSKVTPVSAFTDTACSVIIPSAMLLRTA